MFLPSRVLGRAGEAPPSARLNLAVIGAGGRGADDIEELKSENIVALCDVDDRRAADTYRKYPNTGPILPAMGYGREQIADLEETINRTPVDMVIIATPIDLGRLVDIDKPNQRVRYELQEIGRPDLTDLLKERFGR